MGPALFILLDFGAALRVYRLQMAILAESETGLASGFSRLLPAFPGFSFFAVGEWESESESENECSAFQYQRRHA